MLDRTHTTLTFLVPGIMGSTLIRNGSGKYGEPVYGEEVWSADMLRNADLLATNPDKLALPDAIPGRVIESMSLGILSHIPVYGELVRFCTQAQGLGLTEEQNFFPFPYDWRTDNFVTSKIFANFIKEKAGDKNVKFRFIAHSMGGIVVRLMLVNNPEIAKNTEMFFQIASPIKGSAKAYYTLKERPCLNKFFDKFWNINHHRNPSVRARLLNTLRRFESLYQLLPPDNDKIMFDINGEKYSAFAEGVWQSELQYASSASRVHELLASTLIDSSGIKRHYCVYSHKHSTDLLYLVDENYNLVGRIKDRSVSGNGIHTCAGDGTVACSSAFANSSVQSRHLIDQDPSEHGNFCRNKQVFNLLREAFV